MIETIIMGLGGAIGILIILFCLSIVWVILAGIYYIIKAIYGGIISIFRRVT